MPSLWLCGEHVFNRTHGRVTGESRRVSPLCETPPRPSHAGTARSSFRSQVVPSGWMCSWCLLLSHLPLCRRRCTADSSLPRPSALCLPSLPALLCTPFRQCIPLLPAMPPSPPRNASLSSPQCPLALQAMHPSPPRNAPWPLQWHCNAPSQTPSPHFRLDTPTRVRGRRSR